MKGGNDFGELAKEFQAINDAPREALVRAIEKGRRRLVRGMILGGVLSALMTGVSLFILWKDRDAPAVALATLQIGGTIAMFRFGLRSQKNAWHAHSETTRGFLDLEIERRRNIIRRMRFLLHWFAPAMFAGMALFHALLLRKDPSMLSAEPSSIIGFGGAYVICAFAVWGTLRKKARYERQEADLLKEKAALEDGEGP